MDAALAGQVHLSMAGLGEVVKPSTSHQSQRLL
jgi:hypothetical protein